MAAKKKSEGTESTLTISGLDVVVTHERVSIDDVRLDPNNPRIRLQIRYGTKKKPTSPDDLLALVREQPGYDDLQKQIRKLGGIYDPIIGRAMPAPTLPSASGAPRPRSCFTPSPAG